MPPIIHPLLMFEGRAEEAMRLYVSLFDDAAIDVIDRYGPGEPGPEGKVRHATFHLGAQVIECIDSPISHDFTFTPSISLSVIVDDRDVLDRVFTRLAEGGTILMPLGPYPHSSHFGWLADEFGVSWQIQISRD